MILFQEQDDHDLSFQGCPWMEAESSWILFWVNVVLCIFESFSRFSLAIDSYLYFTLNICQSCETLELKINLKIIYISDGLK